MAVFLVNIFNMSDQHQKKLTEAGDHICVFLKFMTEKLMFSNEK